MEAAVVPNNRQMQCPTCGCELWIIESNRFKCFVCGFGYHDKHMLLHKNIQSLNAKLKQIAPGKE